MRVLSAPDGDLPVGNLAVVDGLESVRQRVAQRVRHYLGEWFLDTASGVPYHRDVLRRPASVGIAVAAVTHAIRSVEGVVDVLDAQGEIDSALRMLKYSATVKADSGTFGIASTMDETGATALT